MLSINAIFIIINVIRYVVPLRLKQWVILSFYVLASLQTLGRIIELSYIANSKDDNCTSITDAESYV